MKRTISVESDSHTVQNSDNHYCKSRNHSICSTHSISSMSSTESKTTTESCEVLGKAIKKLSTEHKFQWNDKTRAYSYDSNGSNPSTKPTPRVNTFQCITSVPHIRKRDITVDEMEERIPTPQPLKIFCKIREKEHNAWTPETSSKYK